MRELDEKILTFAKRSNLGGTRSWKAAKHYNIETRTALEAFKRLERAGLVVRDERASASNDIFWRPSILPRKIVP